jgi:catechol 2,3-dioxygenase-like lactoylglutathione lyase family enzyme
MSGMGMSRTGMGAEEFESLILFVADLAEARAFYVDPLGLPVRFDDDIIVVVGGPSGRVVLHRNDRGHDERGISPAGTGVGGAAVASPSRIPTRVSATPSPGAFRSCDRHRKRPGVGSSSWRIPTAAPSSWPKCGRWGPLDLSTRPYRGVRSAFPLSGQ